MFKYDFDKREIHPYEKYQWKSLTMWYKLYLGANKSTEYEY